MNPFDYVNAINAGKNIMTGTDNDELAEKGYNPFLTNRQFSYFQDTVLIANEMNANGHLDSKLQFSFLINIIRPKKRFARWAKTEHHDDLECVVQYYNYSYEKAKQVMDILSSDDLEKIKRRLEKGGLKK
jgi:methyltransferase-like protein